MKKNNPTPEPMTPIRRALHELVEMDPATTTHQPFRLSRKARGSSPTPLALPRTCENPTTHGFDDASERIPKSLGGLSGRWKEQGRNE
jgi:hypothetical protein